MREDSGKSKAQASVGLAQSERSVQIAAIGREQ